MAGWRVRALVALEFSLLAGCGPAYEARRAQRLALAEQAKEVERPAIDRRDLPPQRQARDRISTATLCNSETEFDAYDRWLLGPKSPQNPQPPGCTRFVPRPTPVAVVHRKGDNKNEVVVLDGPLIGQRGWTDSYLPSDEPPQRRRNRTSETR